MNKETDKYLLADKDQPEIVIPRENAVFWLDENGHWYNEGGRFKLKRLSIALMHPSRKIPAVIFFPK